MIYKDPDCETQLQNSPPKLKEIASYFEGLSQADGINPIVTRVWDPVQGDSGVHEAHRAVDFRDEHGGVFLYNADQTEFIVNSVNAKYPRQDGKPTCLHHSFHGAPYHFHIQIPIAWVEGE